MTVKLRFPTRKGDNVQILQLEEAKNIAEDRMRAGWITAIDNRLVRDSSQIQDGNEVKLYPPITGG